MKKGLFVFVVILIVLSACNQQGNNEKTSSLEKHKGTIVNVEEEDGQYYMLVISGMGDVNIFDKTLEELEELAREKDGAYYYIEAETYDELDLTIGAEVIVYYDGQGDSDPPVRDVLQIELIS